jgi:hypothetical protein
MLQQTRVQTVIDYFNRWMARWPTVESLSQATSEEVRASHGFRKLLYFSSAVERNLDLQHHFLGMRFLGLAMGQAEMWSGLTRKWRIVSAIKAHVYV